MFQTRLPDQEQAMLSRGVFDWTKLHQGLGERHKRNEIAASSVRELISSFTFQ